MKQISLAGMMLVSCCAIGNAQSIYSDDFTTGGSGNINGTAPTAENTFAGGSSTAKWNDVLGVNNTHSLLANGTDSTTLGDSWLLPFTPQSGYIYTLTAQLTFAGSTGSGDWVGLGFAHANGSNVPAGDGRFADSSGGGPDGYDFMIMTENSGNVQFFSGPKANSPAIYNGTGFTAGPQTLTAEIILNTTAASWTTTSYVDGTEMGTTYTYSSNPGIVAVGLTQDTLSTPANVQWDNFALSATPVPEPSVQVLSGLGLAGMYLLLRRQSRGV